MNDESLTPSTHRTPSSLALVGIVVGAWGVAGEVRVQPHSDNPRRFTRGSRVLVEGQPQRITGCRWHQGYALVKLDGVRSREEAAGLKGARLEVPMEETPALAADTYYHFQILDMEVWTSEGEYLGVVEDILSTGSNDVYVVRGGNREALIPALGDVVTEVDTERGRMTVDLPEGLI